MMHAGLPTSESVSRPPTDNLVELTYTIARLAASGEGSRAATRVGLTQRPIAQGLVEHCERTGFSLEEYVRHTMRFGRLNRQELFDQSRLITISKGAHNLTQNGEMRDEEEGHLMDLEYARGQGVDPDYVLFFRATQPMQPNHPKPELYWTSDALETIRGLKMELGDNASTAIILGSTLADISQGGLMSDINDDNGVAVRRLDFGPYDQSRSLFTFLRESPEQP